MIDVAIIGSGIVGLACARALAGRGLSVALFDAAPERAATRVAAGMLGPWAELPDEASSLEMRERALSLYPAWIESIAEEAGSRPDFETCGTVVIDDGTGSAGTRSILERAPRARRVTESEIRDIAPEVNGEAAARGGVQIPTEGYVDPRTVIDALWRALEDRVAFRVEEVRAVHFDEGRTRGVVTATGVTEARHVVNATGAWAASLAPAYKIRPIRGELVVLAPPGGRQGMESPRRRTGCVLRSRSSYIVPRRDGTVTVGGTSNDVGFDARVTAGGVEGILRRAFEIVPSLQEWEVIEVRAGLRPFLDGGPYVGKDPERAGLVHAIGMHRHGILLAPFVAERVLQEIEG